MKILDFDVDPETGTVVVPGCACDFGRPCEAVVLLLDVGSGEVLGVATEEEVMSN